MTDEELIDKIASSIASARKRYPAPGGGEWDQILLNPFEAHLFARAAIDAIRDAGLESFQRR